MTTNANELKTAEEEFLSEEELEFLEIMKDLEALASRSLDEALEKFEGEILW